MVSIHALDMLGCDAKVSHRFEPNLLLSLSFLKGEKYEVTLRFKAEQIGVYPATLAFEFKEDTQPATCPFHIVRFIQAEYRSELAALLGPEEPFRPKRLERYEPARCNIEEGVPPER